jgi:hypothetical protein
LRRIKIALLVSVVSAGVVVAGHIDITGGIAVFIPPDPGADSTPIYNGEVEYWYAPRASLNFYIGYATYLADAGRCYYIPTKLRSVFHPKVHRLVDPHFGIGMIYSNKRVSDEEWKDALGYTSLMGLNILILSRTAIGGYGEYVVPDWRSTKGYWEYGFNFGGISF